MKNKLKISAFVLMIAGISVLASNVTMVGGEDMFPSKDNIDNAMKSKDHTTLVAAVKAAGLVDTLYIKARACHTAISPAAKEVTMRYSLEGESLIDDYAYEF
jgi:hypothetical protein